MEKNARSYNCRRCHQRIVTCSQCDHGQIYCRPCAIKARKKTQCAASHRYQQTPQGKINHAKRQKHYRERQKQNQETSVTHHTYQNTKSLTSLATTGEAIDIKVTNKVTKSEHTRCHFCHREVSLDVQVDFTRECIEKFIRGTILPRAP